MSSSSTGTAACSDDRPAVEFGVDEMHGRAAHAHAVLERLPLRVEAGKRRQQRRMDVQDPFGKRLEQRRPDQPHEAGQTDQIDVARAQLLDERPVVGVAVGVVARARQHARRCRRRAPASSPAARHGSR